MSLQPDLPEEVIALAATAEAPPRMARRSFWTRAWRELKHAPVTAWFGLIVVAIYIFAAVFAPLIAPYGETALVGDAYEPWGDQFLLGTDQLGRDMLSRLIFGARNTVGIAFLTTIFAFLIGGTLGLLVGHSGRLGRPGAGPRGRRADGHSAADLRPRAALHRRHLDRQPHHHHRHPRFDPGLSA